jgi:hypothetical protein
MSTVTENSTSNTRGWRRSRNNSKNQEEFEIKRNFYDQVELGDYYGFTLSDGKFRLAFKRHPTSCAFSRFIAEYHTHSDLMKIVQWISVRLPMNSPVYEQITSLLLKDKPSHSEMCEVIKEGLRALGKYFTV